MQVVSTQDARQMQSFISNHTKHRIKLTSSSEETGSEFKADLTPQEMSRVLDYIQELQEKGYSLELE